MAEYTAADKKKLDEIHDHMLIMNREMGEVVGELRWIKIIIAGTFLVALSNVILSILGG